MPNTDAALQLAIAYVWMTEGTYDKEYVATHTFGFDKFEDYVLGAEDGVPKTPAWASEKCGVPAWIIKALARDWASKRTTILHGNGGPGIRGPYATEPARLEVLLLAMQGLGKPGAHQVKMLEWGRRMLEESNPMPRGAVMPNVMKSVYTGGMLITTENDRRPHRGHVQDRGQGPQGGQADHPQEPHPRRHPESAHQLVRHHLVHLPARGPVRQVHLPGAGLPRGPHDLDRHALLDHLLERLATPTSRRCAVPRSSSSWPSIPGWRTTACSPTSSCRSTPSSRSATSPPTPWAASSTSWSTRSRPSSRAGSRISDYEIVCKVAERLGLLEELHRRQERRGADRDRLRRLRACKDMVSYEEFKEKGYFVVPTDPDWDKYTRRPQELPRRSREQPAQDALGQDRVLLPEPGRALPRRPRAAAGAALDREGRQPRRDASPASGRPNYPLLVLSNHPRWRCHANHDDITWLREIETCKVAGPGRLQVRAAVDQPGGRRSREASRRATSSRSSTSGARCSAGPT